MPIKTGLRGSLINPLGPGKEFNTPIKTGLRGSLINPLGPGKEFNSYVYRHAGIHFTLGLP